MGVDKKHLVNFSQEGCVYVSDDQTLLNAALDAKVPLYHVCGGNARCSTCRVFVVEGSQWLTPPNASENALKHQMNFPPNVRLACQTYVTGGPVKVSRILRDESDIGLYVGSFAGGRPVCHIGKFKGYRRSLSGIFNWPTVFQKAGVALDNSGRRLRLPPGRDHHIKSYLTVIGLSRPDPLTFVNGFSCANSMH